MAALSSFWSCLLASRSIVASALLAFLSLHLPPFSGAFEQPSEPLLPSYASF
jgi:hypothetical protein